MSKPILFVIALAAGVGVFFLMGGMELLDGGGSSTDGDGAGTTDLLDGSAGGTAGDEAAEAKAKGPTLFGRARSQRVGKGGAYGRVMDFRSGKPVAGALVVLSGTGYGEEKVSTQVRTGEDGLFDFQGVAAGDAHSIHVSGPERHERRLSPVAIDADAARDIGTIWLGKRGTLRGKVVTLEGKPVADAEVQVHGGGVSMMELLRDFTKLFEQLDKDAKPLVAGPTDAAGAFEFEKVAPGPVTLVVRATGFKQAMQAEVMTSDGLAGGELVIRLSPAPAIVGYVVDEHDRPIADARVASLDKNDIPSVLYGRQFEITDDTGRFVINAPPTRGSFAVIVAAQGYPTLLSEIDGSAEEIRLVMHGGTEVLMRLLENGTRRPIEDAHLTAMFSKGESFSGDNMSYATSVTDHRGEATIVARPGKLQMLFFKHPEKGSAMFSPMLGGMGQASVLSGPKDTTIAKKRATFEFLLAEGVTVFGVVADADGKPIPGARCQIVGAMGVGGSATADEDGVYRIPGQSPPVRMVLAAAPGYVQKVDPRAAVGGTPSQPGEDIERNVTMQRESTIAGRVLDPNGKPLPGVRVKLEAGGGMAMLQMMTGTNREAITSADGRYILSGASPGKDARVLGRLAGFLDSQTEAFEVAAGAANQAPDLEMRLGSQLVIKIERPEGGALRGARVEVDIESGDEVDWDPMEAFRSLADLVTDGDGKVTVRDLPDGKVTITASKEGFAANRQVQEVLRKSPPAPVSLRLREGFTMKGRVVDEDGEPVKDAEVTLNPVVFRTTAPEGTPWAPTASTQTDAQGRFSIPDMPDIEMKYQLSGKGLKGSSGSVMGSRGHVELIATRMDRTAEKRIEEIDAKLEKFGELYGAAKSEAERKALIEELTKLQAEKEALQKGEAAPQPSEIPPPGDDR